MINSVVLVSGAQHSGLVIHVSILFQSLFPFRLLCNIEQHSLCYTIGPCWLSALNIEVCTCQSQTSNLSLLPNPCSLFLLIFRAVVLNQGPFRPLGDTCQGLETYDCHMEGRSTGI